MWRWESRSSRRKTSRSRVENQPTQPTYDAGSGNRTRDTLAEGERSHHCANPAPHTPTQLDGYEDLLKRANLFSLCNMRLQDIAIFMYKVKHKQLPSNILGLLIGTPSEYNLRNSDFHISRFCSVHYGKHSLRYLGSYLWSKLGHSDRQIPYLTSFVSNVPRKDLAKQVSNYVCTAGKLCEVCLRCH